MCGRSKSGLGYGVEYMWKTCISRMVTWRDVVRSFRDGRGVSGVNGLECKRVSGVFPG